MLRVPFSLFIVFFFVQFGNAQCPEISTIDFNPDIGASLCPGESITIDLTGMNLPQGTIDWYLQPGSDDFNPYEGEGVPIGESIITPDELLVSLCEPCPTLIAMMIDACDGNGEEEDNEFIIISSGGGIEQAGDIQINLAEQNNFGPTGTNVNNDINMGNDPCGFLNFPDIDLMENLQSTMDCGFDNIIGAGPNDPIPAGALVVIFTSSNWNLAYDFNGLCANGETIYVLQSNCRRERGAFSNSTSSGCRTTFVTIDGCDCQSSINYNTDNASNLQTTGGYVYFDDANGNGEVDYSFGCNSNEIIHNNGIPCVAPPVESVPVPTIPSVIESFTYTIPLDFCDQFGTGIYSIVGAINPLSEECAGGDIFNPGNTEDFLTDTYTFVTTCQQPDLENPADLCIGESILLNDLVVDIDQYGSTGWYDNQDPFAGNEVTSFNASEEGDFTYYFFPTGMGGECYSSGNVTITVTTGTSFTLETDMICQSETAYDLTALEDPSFSDGTWVLNGSAVLDDMFDATGFLGDVELTFEPANPDNSSCLSPQTTTLTVTNGPSLSPSTSNSLGCADNTATLNSGVTGTDFTYQWSGMGIDATNETDAEPSVDQSGMYSVTVTDTTTGCQSIEMVELMQSNTDTPDIDAQINGVITCTDEAIMLDGISNDATSFSWTAPDGLTTFNEENPMVSDTGTYTLTVTDVAGCTASTTLFVDADTMPPMIGVLASDLLINCLNPTISLFGNSPEEDLTDFEWILNNETVSIEQNLNGVEDAGNYTLIVTDMNGCTNTDQVSIAIDTISPVAVIDEDIDVLTCTQMMVALNGTNSSADVGFNWDTPTSTIIGSSPEVSEPGIYTLTVSAVNGCTDTASIEVMQLIDPPSISLAADTLDCSGSMVGIESTSLETITNYAWVGPDSYFSSDANPSNIVVSGPYSVTVTASNGCTNEATTIVETDDDVPTAQIDTLLTTVIDCNNTNLPFEVTNISPNSTIEWAFPNATTSEDLLINAIEEGNYSLMITGDNGCSSSLSIAVTDDTDEPTLQILPTGELNCTNNAGFVINSNTADIVWTLPDLTTQTGANFQATEAGLYTVTATGENGCVNSEMIDVVANDTPPSIDSIESGDLTCTNNEAQLMASSTMSNVVFSWETPNGGETLIGADQTVSVAGEYVLVVTNLNNNCTSTANTTVAPADDAPDALITSDEGTALDCDTENVELVGSSTTMGVTYEWTAPDNMTLSTATIDANQEGIYTLTVINNDCTTTETIAVSLDNAVPQNVAADGATILCDPDSVVLNVSSDNIMDSFEWFDSMDNPISDTNELTTFTEGMYTVVATGTNGCAVTQMVEVVTDNDSPVIDLIESGDLTCTNNEVELSATSSVANATFEWQTPNNGVLLVGADQTVSVAGDYILVITDPNNNCTTTETTTIAPATDAPDALITSDEGTALDCNTENIELVGSSTTMGVMYEWTAPDNTTFSTATIDANQEGTYTLTVINDDCTTTETVIIDLDNSVPQNVVADSGTIFCDPDSVLLNVNSDNIADSFEWFDSMNNPISDTNELTAFADGMYTVVATASNGCTSTASAEVIENDTQPTIVTAGTTLDCDGTAFNLTGGSDDTVTYAWTDENGNPFSDEQNPNVSETGIYTLLVTDTQTGCTNSATAEVLGTSDIPSIAIDNMTPTIDCNSTSVELTANSDASDATFEWFDAAGMIVSTDAIFTGATLGTYTVQVTNSGCSNTQSVEVQDASVQPTVQIDTTSTVLDCENQSIVLTANSNVATPNYEWQNDNGDVLSTDTEYTTTEIGNITLVVFDGNCSNSTSQMITSDGSSPTIEVAITSVENIIDCNTDNVELTGLSMNNVTYSWSGPNGFEANTAIIQADTTGDYILTITDLDNGCTNVNTTTVFDDFAQPEVVTDGGIIDCVSNGVTLSSSTPIPSSTYEWTLNNVFVSDEANPFVSQQGTYTLVVTSPTNGCSDTTTALVTLDTDFPVLEAITEPITCVNTVTFLDASASSPINNDVVYQWSLNDVPVGTNEIMPAVSEAGLYQLIGTNIANQCADTLLLEVVSDTNNPTAVASDDTQINCVINTVTLDGTASTGQGDLSYQWLTFTGDEVSQDSMIEVDTGMPYTLIVTDNINGCTDSTEVEVVDNTLEPQAAIASTGMIDCNQTMVELDANGSIGSTDLDYQWLDVNGVEIGTEAIQTIDAGGVYTLILTNNENGCTDSMPITITEDTLTPNIVFAAPSILTCTNTEVVLNALESDDNTDFTIEWTGPMGAAISDISSLNPTVTQSGDYILTIQNPNNGCANSQTLTIGEDIEIPLAVAATSDELGCDINAVQLLGIGSSQGTGFSYEWSGMSITSENDLLDAEADAAGIYTLIVTNDINGCTEIATTEVVQNEEGIENSLIDFDNETCFGDANGTISITEVVGGAAPYMYGINGENLTNTPDFSNLTPGIYPIVVEDVDGCQWTDSITIEAATAITVELGENILAQTGEVIDLDLLTNAIVDTIIWSEPILEGVNPSFAPVTTTTVNVTVVDENGCTETDAITIFIEQGSSVYIPNAFSPNADGVNDVLKIYGNEAVQSVLSFQIFDRWGTLVYQANDFQLTDTQNEWDGFYKNKALDPAVFVFFAEIELAGGSTEIYKGDITLMR